MKNRRTFLALAIIIPLAVAIAAATISQSRQKTPDAREGDLPALTEFGDFMCPHCAMFAVHAMPEIDREFVDPGRMTYEYRHYPFLGEGSYRAAAAAECARDQGKFRAYHDAVYRQAASGAGDHTGEEALAGHARDNGLDMDLFGECLESGSGMERVNADKALGQSMGVRGTPSLFMGGEPLRWNGYEDLRNQIRERIRSRALGQLPPGDTR